MLKVGLELVSVHIVLSGKEACLNSQWVHDAMPYLFFGVLVVLLALFSKLLDRRFGKSKKKRYKRAVMEVLFGLAAVLSWLAGGDILLLGVQGGVFLLIGLLRYAKFGKTPLP
ncbi:MAG: hypothetical protein ACK5JO_12310 [Halodesulfovibrio sp.]